jgi:hypothetical protein
MDPEAAIDGETSTVSRDRRAEFLEVLAKVVANLSRVSGPLGNADRSSGNEGRREEWCGVREVWFNLDVDCGNRARVDTPDTALCFGDGYPSGAKARDGHLDVGNRRKVFARVAQREPVGEPCPGEKQPRHELARLRCVDRDVAAGHAAGSANRERQRSATVVVDLDA